MTPEGAERHDRGSEVLNEALAKEVERNVRRREEIGSAAGESAVPRESKDALIPPDSDPGKRSAMNAETAVASSGRRVKNGRRGRRARRIQQFERTERQTTNNDENISGGITKE